jgi:hypothetical protein
MAAISQATFTPAASSHATPAVVGGAQEFKSLGLIAECIAIWSCSLRIDGAAETSTWNLHLYDITPPSAIADAGAFTLATAADRACYLGFLPLAQTATFGSTQYVESNNIWKIVRLRGSSLFGYLVNGTTLTPGAVAHVVTLGVSAAE